MKTATGFIEVIKDSEGNYKQMTPGTMRLFTWCLHTTARLHLKTIAVFKIYPKNIGINIDEQMDLLTKMEAEQLELDAALNKMQAEQDGYYK